MSGKHHLYPEEFKACDNCHSKGTIFCEYCNGSGYNDETVYRYDSTGYSYPERIRNRCTYCFGKGERKCEKCDGTGDQRIYGKPNDDLPGENEGDSGYEPPKTKLDILESYYKSLGEAGRNRDEIISWVWNESGFDLAYKVKFNSWLQDLSFDDPGTEQLLKDVALSWSQQGLPTKAETFSLMLSILASICGSIQFYKEMKEKKT